MREIRICWKSDVVHHVDEVKVDGGLWERATPDSRSYLDIVLESINEVHGAGSHWIAERNRVEP